MQKHRFKKLGLAVLSCLLVFMSLPVSLLADAPNKTYSYDFWHDPVPQPATYLYNRAMQIDGGDISLNAAEDIFIANESLFVADTGNNRILELTFDGKLLRIIDQVQGANPATLNRPQGIFVNDAGEIFIADSGHNRVLHLGADETLVRELTRPVTDMLSDSTEFVPTKVVQDMAGRVYVIAYGINMGLIEYNPQGEFRGFLGATRVSVNPMEYIWKRYFSTDAQRERMEMIIPTEYSNITLTDDIFLMSTISNLSTADIQGGADAIRLLNPTGTDILRRLGNYPIVGDLTREGLETTYSKFVDSAVTDFGVYFVLDQTNGKVFAYDGDGNSLFIFGGKGNRQGQFSDAVSLELTSDLGQMFILDRALNTISVFELTSYGENLLGAIHANEIGDHDASTALWQEVLTYNSNSELAYTGIGKSYMAEGRYEEALEAFELGNNRKYYTRAFSFHRKNVMQEYFGVVMTIALVLVAVLLIVRSAKKWKVKLKEISNEQIDF